MLQGLKQPDGPLLTREREITISSGHGHPEILDDLRRREGPSPRGRGSRNALDDAFARQVSPDDAEALSTARRQWGNLKTVERAVTGGGEAAAFGRVSPAQLRQAVASGNNRGAYARGEGDFADLARAGQAVMTPLPNSGTAQRSLPLAMVGLGSSNLALGNIPGAVASMAAPSAMSHMVLSRPGQAYLSNQLMSALEKLPPERAAFVSALLAERGYDVRDPRVTSP